MKKSEERAIREEYENRDKEYSERGGEDELTTLDTHDWHAGESRQNRPRQSYIAENKDGLEYFPAVFRILFIIDDCSIHYCSIITSIINRSNDCASTN